MDWLDSIREAGLGGYLPLFNMLIYLITIGLSWWGLQEFRFDLFLKRPKSPAAKMLQIFLSIALGYLVGLFFIQYLGMSIQFGFFSAGVE